MLTSWYTRLFTFVYSCSYRLFYFMFLFLCIFLSLINSNEKKKKEKVRGILHWLVFFTILQTYIVTGSGSPPCGSTVYCVDSGHVTLYSSFRSVKTGHMRSHKSSSKNYLVKKPLCITNYLHWSIRPKSKKEKQRLLSKERSQKPVFIFVLILE